MTSESMQEQHSALTSDERTLFHKLAWRLWVIGLGLCLLGACNGYLAYSAFRDVPSATDRDATTSESEPQQDNSLLIAVFALLSSLPTLSAAWKATRATRLQIDARPAMFALLIDLNAALKWLSFVMLLLVVSLIAFVVMLTGALLTV
jgi:hypothetical protein